ncbi:phage tail tube protein [Salmonella enterica]
MSQETYYYGQGKVYLAPRGEDGKPGAWRWIGDVSALQVAMTVESFSHKESYSGQRAEVRRLITSKAASVTSTWHDHNPDNLALVLYGQSATVAAGTVTGETLPANIKAGERFSLEHQNISDVLIGELVAEVDYAVDSEFGAVTFNTDQVAAPSVNYKYGASTVTSIFDQNPAEVAFRFEGLNLAENEQKVILELYKLKYDPTSALSLINTDTSLAGLETTAAALADTQRKESDAVYGRYGRLIHVGSAA